MEDVVGDMWDDIWIQTDILGTIMGVREGWNIIHGMDYLDLSSYKDKWEGG